MLWVALFARLQAMAGKDVAAATANALAVQAVERALHVDLELTANRWLVEHPILVEPAAVFYRLYYAVIAGVLVWALVRHAASYVRVRRTLVAMTALALAVYWAFPLSPPRFALAEIVDIVAEHDPFGGHASREVGSGQSHYTAMPSMHVGWAILAAYAAWSVLRVSHPRAALVAWVFPLVMVADVVTTGNHYVLDVVGSAVLFAASLGAAAVWGRLVERLKRGSAAG